MYCSYYALKYILISAGMHIAIIICGSMASYHTSQSHDINKLLTSNVKQQENQVWITCT